MTLRANFKESSVTNALMALLMQKLVDKKVITTEEAWDIVNMAEMGLLEDF